MKSSRKDIGVRPVMAFSSRALLAAGVMIGASLLAACGDSPTAEASKAAVKSADRAARITMSAGEVRTTEEFAKKQLAIDVDPKKTDEEVRKLGASYKNEASWGSVLDLKTLPPAGASAEDSAKFRASRTYDDLKRANDELAKALSNPNTSAVLKTALQSQSGGNSLAQARSQLTLVDRDLHLLGEMAHRIVVAVDDVAGFNAAAGAFESHKDAKTFDTQKTELASRATAAQQAYDDATAKLAGLKTQKAEKEKQAAELEQKSEAQSAEADKIKPSNKANIEKYQKALDEAKASWAQAAALRAEAAVLDSSINATATDVTLAEHAAREAKAAADAVAGASKIVGDAHKSAQEEAQRLRTRIGELVTGKDGINDRVNEFKKLAGEIDARAARAAESASAAQKAFFSAADYQTRANADLRKRVNDGELKPDDPMAKLPDKKDSEATLRALEATSYNTLGQAKLAGHLAAELRGLVAAQLTKVLEPAKQPVPGDVAGGANKYAAEASESFTKGLDAARKVQGVAGPTSPARWLADAALAIGNYGLSVAAPANERDAALTAAKAAAKDAMDKNPMLSFPGLVAAAPASTGGPTPGPTTKPPETVPDVPPVPGTDAPAPPG